MTNERNGDASVLRSYLLGLLKDEAVLTRIEEQVITNEQFAEKLNIAESELIEEYLDSSLTTEERERFGQYFLADPERRRELSLIRNIREISARRPRENEAPRHGFMQRLHNAWPAWRLAAASLAVLAAAVGIWQFAVYNSDTEKGLAALRDAYRVSRPMEVRLTALPEYAPYAQTRGAGTAQPDPIALTRANRYLMDAAAARTDADAHHAYGLYFLAAGDIAKAKTELELAGSLDRSNARIQSDLGALHLEMAKQVDSDEEGARALELLGRSVGFFDTAISLAPRLPEPYFGRALALELVPNPEQAKAAWLKYLEIDGASKWADEARRNLEELEQNTERERSADELESEFIAAFRAGDTPAAGHLSGANRELIRQKYIPQRLAMSLTSAGPDQRPELLQALEFVGSVEENLMRDRLGADIARYYSTATEAQLAVLNDAHREYREGLSACLDEKYAESTAAFMQARHLFNRAGNAMEAHIAGYFAGYSLINEDRIEEGMVELAAVERFAKDNQYPWLRATALHWVGGANAKAKRHSDAVNAYEQALKLAEQTGDRYQLQRNLLELAGQSSYVGQSRKSLHFLRLALLEAARPGTSFRQRFRTLSKTYPILYSAGLPDLAVPAALEAATVADVLGDVAFQSQAKAFAAQALTQKRELERARPLLDEACALAATIPDDAVRARQTAFCRLKFGDLARASGDSTAAEEHYAEAVRYYENANMPLNREEAHVGLLHSYLAQGKTSELEAELPINIRFAEEYRAQIQEESHRASFLGVRTNIYDIATAFEFDRGNLERAYEYSEMSASRALLDRMEKGASAQTTAGNEQKEKLLSDAAPASLSSIRERIHDNAQIVQYTVLDGRVLIWVISKRTFAVRAVPVASWDLEEKIDRFTERIMHREGVDGPSFRKLGRDLYDLTVGPVLPLLDASREVCFVPTKSLYKLPFAALISPAGKPLLEDLRIAYAPSASVFLQTTKRAAEKSLLKDESVVAVGNPRFVRDRFRDKADLPSAAAEAETVAGQYSSARTLIGPEATKAEFLKFLPNAEIAHFAGHYVVVPGTPSMSYLLMAGGGDEDKLTNLELARAHLPATKLVVLAACRTGVEELESGDGMIGLARTMLALDVPVVIGTHWDVDSASTARLMGQFHHLRRSGRSSTAALREAQLELFNDPSKQYSAPYYWAAFAAFGGYAEY